MLSFNTAIVEKEKILAISSVTENTYLSSWSMMVGVLENNFTRFVAVLKLPVVVGSIGWSPSRSNNVTTLYTTMYSPQCIVEMLSGVSSSVILEFPC